MRSFFPLMLSGVAVVPAAQAANLNLTVDIPKLNVAEYHRPYVAIWIEGAALPAATNLAVWYDLDMKNNEGTKWLRDMRQWWRKSGRALTMPVDGISGATRAPGTHSLAFTGGKAPLGKLPAGSYELVVEAAREVGGRELVRIPFQWPPKSAQSLKAQGQTELGGVSLQLKP